MLSLNFFLLKKTFSARTFPIENIEDVNAQIIWVFKSPDSAYYHNIAFPLLDTQIFVLDATNGLDSIYLQDGW